MVCTNSPANGRPVQKQPEAARRGGVVRSPRTNRVYSEKGGGGHRASSKVLPGPPRTPTERYVLGEGHETRVRANDLFLDSPRNFSDFPRNS